MEILYEDDAIVFVSKPPGILVQQAWDSDEENLIGVMERRAADRGESVFLMQRLDRGTSGVMFFTKKSELNARVTRAFERKEIRKSYLALVEGRLEVPQLIDAPIARIGAIKFGVGPDGKRAVTRVRPLDVGSAATLVRVELLTGRTHQIRVHLAAIGHALVADWLYGRESEGKRPMLHAWILRMRHPEMQSPLEVRAEPPADFTEEASALGIDLPRSLGRTDHF